MWLSTYRIMCPLSARSRRHRCVRSSESDLDDLVCTREGLNRGLELMIDNPALGWGIHIDRVEIKDVVLPDSMKRSIARQAEAERERRTRVITADGELQASEKLAQAAETMTAHPAALQLRLLETVVEVAAEMTPPGVSLPRRTAPVLGRATPEAAGSPDDEAAMPSTSAAVSKSEMPKLDPPHIPDDASGLAVDTRTPADSRRITLWSSKSHRTAVWLCRGVAGPRSSAS